MMPSVFEACKSSSSVDNPQETASDLPTLDILLRVLKEADGPISHIEVVLEMSSTEGKTEKPFTLKAPVIFAGVDGIADRIEQLRVTDDEGVEAELTKGVQGTIAHEMIHKWVGGIKGSPGETLWFSEGLVVHYTRLLTFRAGLFSADEFLEDVNSTVTRYITNPLRNLPNDSIEKHFWEDRNAQVVPYDRGSLYFAHIDAQIRAVSKGKRSLDDVTLSMFDRREKGEELTKEMWLELLEKELGPSALTEFDAIIIRGEDFMPDSDAFGPYFKRIPAKLRVFELGFDQRKSLYTAEKRITGLVKGSAAERAGLQNGDHVLNKVDLRALRNDESRRIKLKLRRGDKILEVEYLPRGESVDGYKWVRVPGVPDEKCR